MALRRGKDVQNGDDGNKLPRPRRSFTPEFKAEVVALVRPGQDRAVLWRENWT